MPATTATMRVKQKRECINLFPNIHTQIVPNGSDNDNNAYFVYFQIIRERKHTQSDFSLFLYYFLFAAHAVLVIIYFHSTFFKKNRIQKHTRICIHLCVQVQPDSISLLNRLHYICNKLNIVDSPRWWWAAIHLNKKRKKEIRKKR